MSDHDSHSRPRTAIRHSGPSLTEEFAAADAASVRATIGDAAAVDAEEQTEVIGRDNAGRRKRAKRAKRARKIRKRRSRRYRWIKRGIIAVVLLTTLYLARTLIFGPILASILVDQLAEALGAPVEIASVEGTYADSATVRGLRLLAPPDAGEVRAIHVSDVTLRYDLFGLIRGDDQWLQEIRLVGATIDVDLSTGAQSVEEPGPIELPGRLPPIVIEDVSIRLASGGDFWCRIDHLYGTGKSSPDGETYTTVLQAERFSAYRSGVFYRPRSLALRVIKTGTDTITVDRLQLRDRAAGELIDGASASVVSADAAREVAISFERGAERVLSISGELELFGGTLVVQRFDLDLSSDAPHIAFAADLNGIDLSTIREVIAVTNMPPLAGRVHGSISGDIDLRHVDELALTADLQLASGNVLGLRADELTIKGKYANRALQSGALDWRVGTSRVAATNLFIRFPRPDADFDWTGVSGRVAVNVEDASMLRQWTVAEMLDAFGAVDGAETLRALNWALLRNVALDIESVWRLGQATTTIDLRAPGKAAVTVGPVISTIGLNESIVDAQVDGPIVGSIEELSNLRELHPAMAELGLAGSVNLSLSVGGRAGAPSVDGRVDFSALQVAGVGFGRGEVDAVWTLDGPLAVRNAWFDAGRDRAHVALHWRDPTRAWTFEHVYADVDIADLSAYAHLVGLQPRALQGRVRLVIAGGASEVTSDVLAGGGDGTAVNAQTPPDEPLAMFGRRFRADGEVMLSATRLVVVGQYFDTITLNGAIADDRLIIDGLNARTPFGQVALSGVIALQQENTLIAQLTSMALTWRSQSLRLRQPATISLLLPDDARVPPTTELSTIFRRGPIGPNGALAGLIVGQPIELVGEFGRVSIAGRILPGRDVDFSISADNFNIDDWLREYVGAPVQLGDLTINCGLTDESASVELSTLGLRIEGLPTMSLTLDAILDGQRLDVRTLSLRLASISGSTGGPSPIEKPIVGLVGSVPLDPFAETSFDRFPVPIDAEGNTPSWGKLAMSAVFNFKEFEHLRAFLPEEVIPAGRVEGEVTLAGTWDDPEVALTLKTYELDFTSLDPAIIEQAVSGTFSESQRERFASLRAITFETGLTLADGSLTVRDSRLTIPQCELVAALSGRVQVLGTLRRALAGEDRLRLGEGAFTCNGDLLLLEELPLPLPTIRTVAGQVRWTCELRSAAPDASNLGDVWANPATTADIDLQNGSVRFESGLPPLEALNLNLSIANDLFTIEDCVGEIGAEPFRIRGSAYWDSELNAPWVSVRLAGKNLLLTRERDQRIRADIDVTLSGPLPLQPPTPTTPRATVTGDVTITDGRSTSPIDLYSFAGPREVSVNDPDMILFSITSAPLKYVVIDRLKVRTHPSAPFRVRNNLVVGGIRMYLTLGGTLEVPEPLGDISFNQLRVKLPTGTLSVETGVLTFDTISPFDPRISLVGRIRVAGYDITVSADSRLSRVQALELEVSSNPPLPNDELLFLLLTGQPPREVTTDDSSSLAAAQNVAVFIGRDLLNRLFDSGPSEGETILDRIELETGEQTTDSGAQTVRVRLRMAEDLLGGHNDLAIEGERDIYDEYNAGVVLRIRFK